MEAHDRLTGRQGSNSVGTEGTNEKTNRRARLEPEGRQGSRRTDAGQVVIIPPNVKHRHGAARDGWFSHVPVEIPGEETATEWLEPVESELYRSR
ncbi:MAG: hypothetical protein MSS85_01530 [Pyramidobacter sp.]|nr:hypothetical protein [Pyramidobacter sp.]